MEKLVSIVIPMYNSNLVFLYQAVDSAMNQTYNNVEVILVDDGSSKREHLNVIKKYPGNNRLKLITLDSNSGTSNALNTGISAATGDYIGFLDHDDVLDPRCIDYVLVFLESHKDCDMVYTDEDKINTNNKIVERVYKEDYVPSLLLSMMYINHFQLYRSEKLREFLPIKYDGAQDFDLVLRFAEKYKIGHIKELMYHWRISPTSSLTKMKDYIVDSSFKAVSDALKRRGMDANILPGVSPTQWHVDPILRISDPVSIIIVTKDKPDLIKACIRSIDKYTDYPHEIIIVDTGSTDTEVLEYYKEICDRCTIVYDKFNYSLNNNMAAKLAKYDYICFMNNDIVATPNWLTEMMKYAQQKNVGIVGPKLLFTNDTIQHAGLMLGSGGLAGHMHIRRPKNFFYTNYTKEVSGVTGACLLIRKSIFEEVDGFDPEYMIEFQDVDLCLKVSRKEYIIIYTPYAVLYHYGSATRGEPSTIEMQNDRSLFATRWKNEILSPDPNAIRPIIDPNTRQLVEHWSKVRRDIVNG